MWTNSDSADGLVFLREQLRLISPRVFERKLPALKSQALISAVPGVSPGAEEVVFISMEATGVAEFKNPGADDMPVVGMASTPNSSRIAHIMLGLRYSFQEMRQGEMAALNTIERKMLAARKGHETKHDELAWIGSAAKGIWGLVSSPNVGRLTAANALSTASTGEQMLAVLNTGVRTIISATNGVERPNTLVMTPGALEMIRATPLNATGDPAYTVLRAFREAHPEIDQIEDVHWLVGQGDSATDVMVFYNRDPMNVEQIVGMVPEFGIPQAIGTNYEIPGESRHGGVVVHYPMSVLVVQGI